MADDARRSTPPTAATILVVHDDPQTAELARQALAGDRVEVIGVGSAAEAESTLAEREVAVIVLALVLPDAHSRRVSRPGSRGVARASA
jgi:DNA-binding response OmpR family regulator